MSRVAALILAPRILTGKVWRLRSALRFFFAGMPDSRDSRGIFIFHLRIALWHGVHCSSASSPDRVETINCPLESFYNILWIMAIGRGLCARRNGVECCVAANVFACCSDSGHINRPGGRVSQIQRGLQIGRLVDRPATPRAVHCRCRTDAVCRVCVFLEFGTKEILFRPGIMC